MHGLHRLYTLRNNGSSLHPKLSQYSCTFGEQTCTFSDRGARLNPNIHVCNHRSTSAICTLKGAYLHSIRGANITGAGLHSGGVHKYAGEN